MTQYNFDLVLDGELTDQEADALAVANPEMHSMGGGGGAAVAHLTAEGATFPEAVTRMVEQLEATGHRVVRVDLDDSVLIEDICVRTGRDEMTVRMMATGKEGPGGFPAPILPVEDGWETYPWTAVRGWFRHHFPDQHFEVDRQADVANLVLRARNLTRGEHTTTWTQLLTS